MKIVLQNVRKYIWCIVNIIYLRLLELNPLKLLSNGRDKEIVTRNEANVKSFMTLIKCIAEFLVLVTNLIVYKRDRKKMKRKTEVR